MTPGSPTGAPQDDAQPTEAHGDGGDAGRAGEGLSELEIERRAVFRMGERIINVVIERDDALAERDRARATAVLLEAELARYRVMMRSLAPRGGGLLPRDGAE